MQKKESIQQRHYEHYVTASDDDLYAIYRSWNSAYPRCIAPMIKLIADLRGINTSNWDKFYD